MSLQAASVSHSHADTEGLRVDFLESVEAMRAIGPRWEELNQKRSDHEAPLFQSHGWNMLVARVRSERSPDRYKPLVAVVRRAGNIVGLWPLSLQRGSGLWFARSLDHPFGQFAGVAFERREDIAPGVAAIVAALKLRRDADVIEIEKVIEGTPLHAALRATGASESLSDHSVYMDFRPFASESEFLQSRKHKTRQNYRNAGHRLDKLGSVEKRVTQEPGEVSDVVRESYSRRLSWMRELGKTAPAFRDADYAAVLEAVADDPASLGLIGFSLKCGGETLALQWGFNYLGRYYAYISARNMDYDQYSVGRYHLGEVLLACVRQGVEVAELMSPASDYKMQWTPETKEIDDFRLPLSVAGKLHQRLWVEGSRPLVKRLYFALPQTLRTRLSQIS